MKQVEISVSEIMPEIRHVARVDGKKGEVYTPWRLIYDYEIIFVMSGEILVKEKDVSYALSQYDFHIMPPNVWHERYMKSDEIVYYNVHFDFRKEKDNLPFATQGTYIHPKQDQGGNIVIDTNLMRRTVQSIKNFTLPRVIKISDVPVLTTAFERMCEDFLERELKSNEVSSLLLNGQFMYLLGKVFSEIENTQGTRGLHSAIEEFKQIS